MFTTSTAAHEWRLKASSGAPPGSWGQTTQFFVQWQTTKVSEQQLQIFENIRTVMQAGDSILNTKI